MIAQIAEMEGADEILRVLQLAMKMVPEIVRCLIFASLSCVVIGSLVLGRVYRQKNLDICHLGFQVYEDQFRYVRSVGG